MANGTGGGVSELRAKLERAKQAASRIKEKGDEVVTAGVGIGVACATAATLGVIEGYTGTETKIADIPAELVVGGGAVGYALLSGTRHQALVVDMAKGALSVASFKAGQRLGQRAKKNKTEKGSIFGDDPTPGQFTEGQPRYSYGSNVVAMTRASDGLEPLESHKRPRIMRGNAARREHHAWYVRDWRGR